MEKRQLRMLLVTLACVSVLAIAGYAEVQSELCFILDNSGSVLAWQWNLQTDGLAAVIEDPGIVRQDGSVEFTLIQLGTAELPGARVEIGPVVITTDNAIEIADAIRQLEYEGGGTPYGAAIDAALEALRFRTTATQVIILSSDGQPNSDQVAIENRNRALVAGVDRIAAIAVGKAVENAEAFRFLQQEMVHPYIPVRPVANFERFKDAVRELLPKLGMGLVNPSDIRVSEAPASTPGQGIGMTRAVGQAGKPIYFSIPAKCPGGGLAEMVLIRLTSPEGNVEEVLLNQRGLIWSGAVPVPSGSYGDTYVIDVIVICDGMEFPQTIGELTLIDPSGYIFEDLDGDGRWNPATDRGIPGAIVTLEHLVDGRWEVINPFVTTIAPAVNPQRSDFDGHYGWDVVGGTYYRVKVEANCYQSTTSREVYVPPEVIDLHVPLAPKISVVGLYSDNTWDGSEMAAWIDEDPLFIGKPLTLDDFRLSVLSQYDTLVLRMDGTEESSVWQALWNFVNTGKGIILEWSGAAALFSDTGGDLYAVQSIQGPYSGTVDYGSDVGWDTPVFVVDDTHPVTQGVTSFSHGTATQYFYTVSYPDTRLTTLATYDGHGGTWPAVLVDDTKRIVLLMFDAADDTQYTTGELARLWRNAIRFCACSP